MEQIRRIMRPTDVPDQGLLCDLLWSDPDKETMGWGENDRGVSFTFGAEVVAKFLHKHDLDLICRAHQVSISLICETLLLYLCVAFTAIYFHHFHTSWKVPENELTSWKVLENELRSWKVLELFVKEYHIMTPSYLFAQFVVNSKWTLMDFSKIGLQLFTKALYQIFTVCGAWPH